MGFNKKAKKEAARQQAEAMALQRRAYEDSRRMFDEYRLGFNKRNEGLIRQREQATSYLDRYNRGEDIASLNPALAKNAQQSAQQVTKTMQFASKLGDARGGDANYQAKLNSVSGREISKVHAAMNEAGLMNEVNSQRGILMDTSNFLNADAQAGLGLQSQLFSMTGSIFQAATTRRQMEIQQAQASMQNVMGLVSGAISGVSSVLTGGFSAGGAWAGGGGNACWIAEVLYGKESKKTYLLRLWINTEFRKTWYGSFVRNIYMNFGQQTAKILERVPVLQNLFRPVFNAGLKRAIVWANN